LVPNLCVQIKHIYGIDSSSAKPILVRRVAVMLTLIEAIFISIGGLQPMQTHLIRDVGLGGWYKQEAEGL